MQGSHYPLLTLTRSGLAGPLSAVIAGQGNRSAKMKALLALSRVIPGELNLLGLRAGLDGQGEFWAVPTGLLARGLGRGLADSVVQAVRGKGRPLLQRDGQLIFNLFQPAIPSTAAMKVLASHIQEGRTGRPLPATATIQVTARCQCDCVHCSAARHRKFRHSELTTDELKSLIRQTEALGIVNITFTGGEPLLRGDVCELIAWVDKDEANAMMFTNGLLLTEENIGKLKEAGLFSLMVSLDSPKAEAHNRMRRVDRCWERAVQGIERTLAAGLPCGISTYATPERLRQGMIIEMIELGRRIGVHEIVVFDVVPTGKLLRGDEQILLTQEDKDALCRMEAEVNARDGYPHIITAAHVEGPTGMGCYAGWFQFYATAYGDITPCDFTPLGFGDIRRESLADIWERMISHRAYCDHCDHCRMQDAAFRQKWIDPIPDKGPFPYPVERLQEHAAGPAAAAQQEDEEEYGYSSFCIRAGEEDTGS